ncbi:MAG: phytanoyl-CoA dioxygenase family protein [Marinoscillum sp.]
MTTGDRDRVIGTPLMGDDVVLAKVDNDLTLNQPWSDVGFAISPFLKPDDYRQFYQGFELLFNNTLLDAGLEVPSGFTPKYYHQLVADNYEQHLKVIGKTKLFDAVDFPIDMSMVEKRVSELLKVEVKSIKPMNKERVFHLRVIRPGSADYNPLHRDAWQDENRGAINIYVPLIGSNQNSSLQLCPGSHLWPESATVRSKEGALMNEVKFNVPGLISSDQPIELIRPNPGENEMLIFSPYTIHGLSANHNLNETRISLEMRFWRI